MHAPRPADPDRQAGLVQAKWTDQILDEVFRNITANRPDLDPEKLARTRALMNKAARDCLVTGYEPVVDVVDLPDADDRHVLAAAIKARAQVIVTNNLEDFPPIALETWDMEAKAPDDFILDQVDLSRETVDSAVQRIADSRQNPPGTFDDVLAMLGRYGLVEASAALRHSRGVCCSDTCANSACTDRADCTCTTCKHAV